MDQTSHKKIKQEEGERAGTGRNKVGYKMKARGITPNVTEEDH